MLVFFTRGIKAVDIYDNFTKKIIDSGEEKEGKERINIYSYAVRIQWRYSAPDRSNQWFGYRVQPLDDKHYRPRTEEYEEKTDA